MQNDNHGLWIKMFKVLKKRACSRDSGTELTKIVPICFQKYQHAHSMLKLANALVLKASDKELNYRSEYRTLID